MKEISILIGGKACDGIRQAGHTLARILNRIGYRIFFYDDYPSLIRGGHNFSIVRASEKRIEAHEWVYGDGDRIPTGIFCQARKPTYEEKVLGRRIPVKLTPGNIRSVLEKHI